MNAVRQPQLQQGPYSIQAEQAVLGGLMLDNSRWDDAAEFIGEDDFYRADHRLIWRAIAQCRHDNLSFDVVTLSEILERKGQLESAGGLAHLATIARDTPTAENVLSYAKMISERSRVRRALKIAAELQRAALANDDGAMDTAIRDLTALSNHRSVHEFSIFEVMRNAVDALDVINEAKGGLVGISSGLTDLDACLGGFQRSDLVVVGARPSVGKTALLLNFAGRCGAPCGIISAEQPHEQLGFRLIAIDGRVSVHRMRTASLDKAEWNKVTSGSSAVAKLQIWVNDLPAPTVSDVIRQARKWKHQHGIKILFLDYLQRIKADNPRFNFRERTAETAMALKELARELDIPVVALAQVNREVEKRDDKRPYMSDLKEAGEIEQEADQILTLYRDEVYNPNNDSTKGIAEINVCKNRHGPTGVIRFAWLADYMRFENLAKGADAAPGA